MGINPSIGRVRSIESVKGWGEGDEKRKRKKERKTERFGEKDRWRQEEKREEGYRVYVGETRTKQKEDENRDEGEEDVLH